MPIQVTCNKCLARFQVSEKFAGKTGPCPKCKAQITVPEAEEEVVIHAPEGFGPKDSSGRPALKPIEREETKVTPVTIVAIVGAIVITLIVAWLVGSSYKDSTTGVPLVFLGIGATLLGPPLAAGAYGFLRNQELEPFRGSSLWLRALVCGLIYAVLWGVFFFAKGFLFDGELEMFHYAFVLPPLIALGGVTALASMEMDFMTGAMHYGVYLGATVVLRLLMNMTPF